VRLKGRLRRLERATEADMVVIPQKDGSVARFPQSASADAVLNFFDRLGAGEDAPPEHPLLAAARNSSDPWWRSSFYAVDEDVTAPIEDLSEA
jgi:hypothetical protein